MNNAIYNSILEVKRYDYTYGSVYRVTYNNGKISNVPSDNVYLKKWIDDKMPIEIIGVDE